MHGTANVLLIDNHDSYSYNLVHLFASVTGTEPRVVANDGSQWDDPEGLLSGVDAVVISPGPGRPSGQDIGCCGEVLRWEELPVLGVCLGHQLIAHTAGGRVDRAREPRHGHLSTIHHADSDLFEGLPPAFTAVRYHSLVVQPPLPAALEALAWSEDGEIMALRHRRRPWWGVQFHPESICTEHGPELAERFLELGRTHAGGPVARGELPA